MRQDVATLWFVVALIVIALLIVGSFETPH